MLARIEPGEPELEQNGRSGYYLPVGWANSGIFGFFSFSAEEPPEGVASFFARAAGAAAAFGFFSGFVAARVAGGAFRRWRFSRWTLDVVCTAAFSALVSFGGVMSGVLLGTESDALLPPPQAPRSCTGEQQGQRDDGGAKRQRSPARDPSGSMRRPQVGQSLRSLLGELVAPVAKRRFSRPTPGARTMGQRGRTLPTASSIAAVVAVEVDLVGLGVEHDLAPVAGFRRR